MLVLMNQPTDHRANKLFYKAVWSHINLGYLQVFYMFPADNFKLFINKSVKIVISTKSQYKYSNTFEFSINHISLPKLMRFSACELQTLLNSEHEIKGVKGKRRSCLLKSFLFTLKSCPCFSVSYVMKFKKMIKIIMFVNKKKLVV